MITNYYRAAWVNHGTTWYRAPTTNRAHAEATARNNHGSVEHTNSYPISEWESVNDP